MCVLNQKKEKKPEERGLTKGEKTENVKEERRERKRIYGQAYEKEREREKDGG